MNDLKREKKIKINRSNLKHLLGIYHFILPYKRYFILGLICLFFSNLTLLAFPYFTGQLVDSSTDGIGLYNINSIAFLLFGLLALQGILSFFRIFLFAQVSEKSMADMRSHLYKKYLYLPLSFYDQNRIGALLSRITSDVTILQDTFSLNLAEFIRQVILLIAGIVVISITTPRLTLFMIAIFPVIILVAIILGRFIKKITKARQSMLAEANVVVEETMQSISSVKAFTNETFELKRYGLKLQSVVKMALKAAKFRGLFASFVIFALFGSIILVLWYGAKLIQENRLTVGELTSFIIYMMFIGGSVAGLGDIYGMLQKALGASERILQIFNQADEENDLILNSETPRISKIENIIFKDVYFAYPTRKDAEVIKGINIDVKGGQKIAFVGHSGGGKSTLIQLLLRFYKPSKGHIHINDHDSKKYDLKHYRDQIGYVSQEIILFGGTIKENILYGNPEASESMLWAAIEQANALEFINAFPEGLDTLVGERGIKLSGGQKQRIAIARTILKDPKILILDEATSSLDAQSEQNIQGALHELMKDKTTIIIAHRLSTIRQVDKIYVIDNGEIKEEGTPEDLLKDEEGIYRNLVKIQMDYAPFD